MNNGSQTKALLQEEVVRKEKEEMDQGRYQASGCLQSKGKAKRNEHSEICSFSSEKGKQGKYAHKEASCSGTHAFKDASA